MEFRYVDVTNSDDKRVQCPEALDGFLGIGFSLLGRVLVEADDMDIRVGAFGERWKDSFVHYSTIPTGVLVAEDAESVVTVSWFFDSTAVRFRSILADGSLVETWGGLSEPTPDRGGRVNLRPGVPTSRRITMADVPRRGRSARMLNSLSHEEIWWGHQRHLAEVAERRRAYPRPFVDINRWIGMAEHAQAHETRCALRANRLWYFGPGIGIVLISLAMPFMAAIALLLLVMAVFYTDATNPGRFFRPLPVFIAPRWLRPRFPPFGR